MIERGRCALGVAGLLALGGGGAHAGDDPTLLRPMGAATGELLLGPEPRTMPGTSLGVGLIGQIGVGGPVPSAARATPGADRYLLGGDLMIAASLGGRLQLDVALPARLGLTFPVDSPENAGGRGRADWSLEPIRLGARLTLHDTASPGHTGQAAALTIAARLPVGAAGDARTVVEPGLTIGGRLDYLQIAGWLSVPVSPADNAHPIAVQLAAGAGARVKPCRACGLSMVVAARGEVVLTGGITGPMADPDNDRWRAQAAAGMQWESAGRWSVQIMGAVPIEVLVRGGTAWSVGAGLTWTIGRAQRERWTRTAPLPAPMPASTLTATIAIGSAPALPRGPRGSLLAEAPTGRAADATTGSGVTPSEAIDRIAGALDNRIAAIARAVDQLPAPGGGLTRSAIDVTWYQRALRSHSLPIVREYIGAARTLGARAEAAPPGDRARHLERAGRFLEAATILTFALALEVDVVTVAVHADAAGVPFGVVDQRLKALDADLLPLAQAALDLDAAKMRTALAELRPRSEQVSAMLDAALAAIARNARRSAVVLGIADTLLIAMSLYQVARAPVLPGASASSPPPGPMLLGGASVSTSGAVLAGLRGVDGRAVAALAEAVRKLVAAGALDPAILGGTIALGGGAAVAPELRKPSLLAMEDGSGREPFRGARALGEGPEVGAVREVGKRDADAARPPRHHVLPQQERQFFRDRGFRGKMDIDNFCIELSQGEHEATHGGGNWRLAKKWPQEWNQRVMEEIRRFERDAGRNATVSEILEIAEKLKKRYFISGPYVPYKD